MGKQRRQRSKLHTAAVQKQQSVEEKKMDTDSQPPIQSPPDNLFAGINIDMDKLNKDLTSLDSQSIKSYKSSKSHDDTTLSKKEKLKLRHRTLLQKIDTVNQMKLELKQRLRRKTIALMEDTNLFPDIEPLECKSHIDLKGNVRTSNTNFKPKGTEKASKRRRQAVQGVYLYKKLMSNEQFQKDPIKSITEHVATVVHQSKNKMK